MIRIILLLSLSWTAQAVIDGKKITKASFDNSLFQVGDIKYSLLNETQFQASHGSCWVLLDGRPIGGTDFAANIGPTLPDGRGMFLRGKQNGRNDGKGNPEGEIDLGIIQSKSSNAPHQLQHTPYAANQTPVSVPESGDWSAYLTLSPSGGNYARPIRARNRGGESRPDNLTINYFVKIKKDCN